MADQNSSIDIWLYRLLNIVLLQHHSVKQSKYTVNTIFAWHEKYAQVSRHYFLSDIGRANIFVLAVRLSLYFTQHDIYAAMFSMLVWSHRLHAEPSRTQETKLTGLKTLTHA